MFLRLYIFSEHAASLSHFYLIFLSAVGFTVETESEPQKNLFQLFPQVHLSGTRHNLEQLQKNWPVKQKKI